MKELLVAAFEEIRDGFSVDRVIADPILNAQFIDACRLYELAETPAALNWKLYNLRKRGGLSKTARPTVFREQDGYAFASEIAIRSLERKHHTTLDRVLCDPQLAREFDEVAMTIAPGFESLHYRWAALSLRKRNRLKPEILGRAVHTQMSDLIPLANVALSSVPDEQGLYILTNRDRALYIGEARSLRARLKKHLDHSDNKLLAHYLWEFGAADVFLQYHVLPCGTRTDIRKAMELELIRSRRSEFNVRR